MKRPLALIVDDDPDFNKIVKALLAKMGFDAETTTTAPEFLSRLKKSQPTFCLIDLNIIDLGVGYTVIKAVRSVLGPELPLFVVSRLSDRQSIAHALEIGANDYLVKPVDPTLLAAKLARFIKTEALSQARQTFVTVPEGESEAFLETIFELQEADEFGLKLISPHLISKGTVFYFDDPTVRKMTGKQQPVLMTVTSTWVDADPSLCGAYAEFDMADEELHTSMRRWLAENQKRV